MTAKPSQEKTSEVDAFGTLDELTFMRECAARFNAFIHTYPEEAQHVLRAFIPYEHELVVIHRKFQTKPSSSPPGVTFGALYAAVLQTHHGTGYYLRPVTEGDRILRLEVVRQSDSESVDRD